MRVHIDGAVHFFCNCNSRYSLSARQRDEVRGVQPPVVRATVVKFDRVP